MADRKGTMEIEDVLSSIRRLVAADTRTVTPEPAPPPQDSAAADRLLLTPAQRIDDPAAGEAAADAAGEPDPLRAWDEDSRAERATAADDEDIEATLAALEAALAEDAEATAAPSAEDADVAGHFPAGPWAPDGDGDGEGDATGVQDAAWSAAADDLPPAAGIDRAEKPVAAGEEIFDGAPEDAGSESASEDIAPEPEAPEPEAPEPEAPEDIAPEGSAPAAEMPLTEVPEVEAAEEPVARTPRRGFIWEAAFEETDPEDLPPVPDSLAEAEAAWDIAAMDEAATATPEMDLPEREDLTEAAVPEAASLPADDDPGLDLPADPLPEPEADFAVQDGHAPAPATGATEPEPAAALPAPAIAAGVGFDADPEAEEMDTGLGLFEGEDGLPLDEAALRDLVAEIIRDELRGALGARIARNLRQMVRQELARELAARGLSDDS